MKIRIFFLLLAMVLSSCGSSNSASPENIEELVNSKNYEIVNNWAVPMRGTNINLLGNPNAITFKNDSVEVYLPYFGVRQSGGGYSGEGGIKYNGPMENVKYSEGDKNALESIRFDINIRTENLRFFINIYPTGKTTTNVNSSQRDAITYRGQVQKIEKE